jgi:hypothetical protein
LMSASICGGGEVEVRRSNDAIEAN